jgi:hypothetical protein
MKTSRDRAIEDVASTIGRKFTGRYEALLKRAASARKIELVVNIKRKLKYIKLPKSPWNHGFWVGWFAGARGTETSVFWIKGGSWFENEKRFNASEHRHWRKLENGEDIGIVWELRGWKHWILSPDGKMVRSKEGWVLVRKN